MRYFDSLGQGWFGWIVRGRYRKSKGEDKPDKEIDQSVIVCMLKEEANLAEKRSFLEDIQFAAQFSFLPEDNPNADIAKEDGAKNVIKLIGACVENPPFLAIYEECPQGDLKTFLLNSRGKIVGYAVIAFNQTSGCVLYIQFTTFEIYFRIPSCQRKFQWINIALLSKCY